MKKLLVGLLTFAAACGAGVSFSGSALAHNRAHVILPSGACMVVGSEKSVTLPDGTLHDLRPETTPADEIGTSFAAEAGKSRLLKGGCS